MNDLHQDNPGVLIFPPLLYGGMVGLGLILHAVDHRPLLHSQLGLWLGGLLTVLGLGIAFWGRRVMRIAGTSVNPNRSATRLVITGPFRFSRNPLYVAMTLTYVGITLMVNSFWLGILLLPLVVLVQWGVIAREERYLESKFKEEYREYRKQVRPWL